MPVLSQQDPPERIAIFRALNLGDMLCSMPALRALREYFPHTHITLVGLPNAQPLVERFSHYLDDLLVFPGDPAFPEQTVRESALPDFYRDARSRRFDLALQMHGSGLHSNDIVSQLGARQWAGFVPHLPMATQGRFLAWPDSLHEIHRYLALLQHLGVPATDDALEFPLSEADQQQAARACERLGLDPARSIFIHPGARLLSRRWPVERYAEVAAELAAAGWQIAVTGSPDEAALAQFICDVAPARIVNLCGQTSLGTLAGILAQGRLLISNDTGISHVAAGVGLRSVIIACGSDVTRWAPLNHQRHRVLHEPMACRPCAYFECPIGHPCANAIRVADVLEKAQAQLSQSFGPPHQANPVTGLMA